jgi:hypothetical protein
MRSFFISNRLLGVCFLGVSGLSQQLPETMTKLSVRLESSDVPKKSFTVKPRMMYRASNGYCRIEELPDPEHGIHGLMILNEPDVWMLNLLTKTAQHFVDPGPTFNCHLPIFQGDVKSLADKNNPLLELEFAQEIGYFKGKGAVSKEGPVLRDKPTTAYAVDVGDSQLFLFTTGTPERPWAVARQHGDVNEIFWYGDYQQLPFDPKLFARPEGIKIEEIK